MEDYQKRVVTEKKELDGRINKLNAFLGGNIFNKLSTEERKLLNLQCKVMGEYSTILNDRIVTF